jgi:hypothetical protein
LLHSHSVEYSKYWFGEDAKVESDPSVKEAQIEYTKYLFIQALKVDPDDTHTLYQYANFFFHAQQYDLAEVGIADDCESFCFVCLFGCLFFYFFEFVFGFFFFFFCSASSRSVLSRRSGC